MYVCVFRGFISSARALTVIYLYGRVCAYVRMYVCVFTLTCQCHASSLSKESGTSLSGASSQADELVGFIRRRINRLGGNDMILVCSDLCSMQS